MFELKCNNCNNNTNLSSFNDREVVCNLCGVVIVSYQIINELSYNEKSHYNIEYNTLDEKLTQYIKNICTKLDINKEYINDIVNFTQYIFKIIKKYDGTKRGNVKDGLILVCISYIYKYMNDSITVYELSKMYNIDNKYVNKAEKIILSLIHRKKIDMDKSLLLFSQQPIYYINSVIQKYNIVIDEKIKSDILYILDDIKNKNKLSQHNPISIASTSFYFVLKQNNINIDIKFISHIFNISNVTIIKSFNNLINQI